MFESSSKTRKSEGSKDDLAIFDANSVILRYIIFVYILLKV